MSILRRAEKKGAKFQNPVETQVGGLSLLTKILPLYLQNKEERVPRRPLGPFRTDAAIYEHPPASGLRVTWSGHSTLLIEIDGVRVLADPVWDERASPVRWAGPKRFFEAPLPLEALPPVDVILISHDHYDHLGKWTVQHLTQSQVAAGARWVTSLGVGQVLQGFGVPKAAIVELDWTESLVIAGQAGAELRMTAVPARHFSGRGLFRRFETLWSSFVLEGREHRVYFGADSGYWEGLREIGRVYGPFDLTMLEIGASHELWRSIHMGPEGAAQAFGDLGGRGLLLPIHWGLFDLALHAWRQPIERMTELADALGIALWAPEPGMPIEVVAGKQHRSGWWKQE